MSGSGPNAARASTSPNAGPGDAFLAGDIGGTKTILALFTARDDDLRPVREETYQSREHAAFDEILSAFERASGGLAIRAACFDVAGPVVDGRVKTTNLPWMLDERELARRLGIARVKLLNDLEATAYGMLHLPPEDLVELNRGTRPAHPGNVAVIAAGTGLGEAMLYWDGSHHHPIASEGGHADFAPRSDLEIDLLRFLRAEVGGHVSCERVLSGPGVFAVYRFLRSTGVAPEPDWLARDIAAGDPSAAVSRAALERGDDLATRALDLFCELYGAEAGNMALRALTAGGVYVGGGIAPKILPALKRGTFMRGFTDKGRFAGYVGGIDVRVCLNPRAALIGSANFARRL
ncbi:MAG TPA: glucokinase [Candidatus Binatia bacterium]|nr:glucokinase [Candidatus Binatia bacterium]